MRKTLGLSLIGLGVASGVSIMVNSGIEAQARGPQILEQLIQASANSSSSKTSPDGPGALMRMGEELTPMADILLVTPPTIPPEAMEMAILTAVSQPDGALASDPELKPRTLNADTGSKTIAIDAGPDNGEAPAISKVDMVQFAAQLWANASFPVEQFQAYTSPFGYRSSPTGGYRQEFHYGLDIAAPRQSYIRNWWAGTVIELSDGGSCGTSVVIQSGEWTHMYCHMQGHVEINGGVPSLIDRDGGIQLWEGQQIIAGDRIGRVGMTGRTTGPHLHWGLKYQGNWVDPAWVLQAMAASYQALYGQNGS